MNLHLATALVVGLTLGLGLWVTLLRLPPMRRRSFADRVEPQLRSIAAGSRLLVPVPRRVLFGPLERLATLALSDVATRLGHFNLSLTGVSARLAQAGRAETALEFRAMQVLWCLVGLLGGLAGALWLLWSHRASLLATVALTGACMLAGYLGYDHLLSARIKRRHGRILAEFPALAELMALAVGAGESALSALDRVARSSRGELSREFTEVLALTRTGVPLVDALAGFAQRLNLPTLTRFVDGISVAVNRGTPLADVLRAQAQDVRDVAKRELMESAGRKEIAMMIPVIFGVLPLTVVFAVFPGLALLQLGP